MSQAVLIEQHDNITVITINRPEARNAVDKPTADLLVAAFLEFESNSRADVAILSGTNGIFCAGADLKAVSRNAANQVIPVEHAALDASGPMGPTRLQLSKPVIAAVDGYAVAGGLELAAWCDLRVAEEDAVFGVFCRRWGVPLIDGGTIRLPRLIGMSRAMDMILTGRPVSAPEAYNMGLANRVVPNGTALTHALELARDISRFPQACMRSDRESAYYQTDKSLTEALQREYELGLGVITSGAVAAGAQRFADGKGRGGDFSEI